ncbi:MAG TPA: GTP cyclohydrolase I, partial [Anaerolineales bacterium]|nr:GTP cyclohydrolase I [Anaerolineales bacterium]
TPYRVTRALSELLGGYLVDPVSILKTSFKAGKYNEMITVGDIGFTSLCVVGSTFVETPRGRIPIQYLKDGDWVYTFDELTMDLRLTQCRNPRITQKRANLVRVYTDNDTVICTPEHKFFTYNRGWVEAKNLKSGDRPVSLYRCLWNNGGPYVALSSRKDDQRAIARFGKHGLKIAGKTNSVPEHSLVLYLLGDQNIFSGVTYLAHHKNEIRWDNDPSNLQGMSTSDHNKLHRKLEKYNTNGTPEYEKNRRAVIESNKKEDTKLNRSISVKKYWADIKANPEKYAERCNQTSIGIQLHRNHLVVGVDPLGVTEDVWCMDVPGTHSFFANGMAVHNCAHHMLPFIGKCHFAYIPDKHIVGLSKIPRMIDILAHRLQVQETLSEEIVDCFQQTVKPRGCAVVIEASHMCMSIRGVKKEGAYMRTTALRGIFSRDESAKAEFLSGIGRVK